MSCPTLTSGGDDFFIYALKFFTIVLGTLLSGLKVADDDGKVCIHDWHRDSTLYRLSIITIALRAHLSYPILMETLVLSIEHLALNHPLNQFELGRDVDFEDLVLVINH